MYYVFSIIPYAGGQTMYKPCRWQNRYKWNVAKCALVRRTNPVREFFWKLALIRTPDPNRSKCGSKEEWLCPRGFVRGEGSWSVSALAKSLKNFLGGLSKQDALRVVEQTSSKYERQRVSQSTVKSGACKYSKPHPAPHCRVLSPGEYNGWPQYQRRSISKVSKGRLWPFSQNIPNLPTTKVPRRYVVARVRLFVNKITQKSVHAFDEMLRDVDRCRDMDELINFWARSRL